MSLERLLRRWDPSDWIDTRRRLENARMNGKITESQAEFLQTCREIRNLLTHQSVKGVKGHVVTVDSRLAERLKNTVDALQSPVKMKDLVSAAATCEPDTPLVVALKMMRDHDYSQLPYRSQSGKWRVFTRNQVACWVEGQQEDGHALVDLGVPVSQIADFPGAGTENPIIAHGEALLVSTLTLFEDSLLTQAHTYPAIIVTGIGRSSVGILTTEDLPRLRKRIEP